MIDWSTVASLATAAGTMVLGIATFASVRSANRAARTAERNFLARMQPVLFPSHPEDPEQKVMWNDRHFAHLKGGQATVEIVDDVIYLAISVRNVGAGMAVLHGWYPWDRSLSADEPRRKPEEFRRLTRDLFIPPAGLGYWQGAIREADDPHRAGLATAVVERRQIGIDILYGDLEAGQRTISRFTLTPVQDSAWLAIVGRHWYLDRPDPR